MHIPCPHRPCRILVLALAITACGVTGSTRALRAAGAPGPAALHAACQREFFARFRNPPRFVRTAAPWHGENGPPEQPGLFADGNGTAVFTDRRGRLAGLVRYRDGHPQEAERYTLRRGALAGRLRYRTDGDGVLAERTAFFDGEPVRIRYSRSTDGVRFARSHALIPGGRDGEYLVENDRIVFRPAPGSSLATLARERERAVGLPPGVLVPLRMGDRVCFLEDRRRPGAGVTYLVIHPDEGTARNAVRDSLARHGGRALIFHGELPPRLEDRRRNFPLAEGERVFRFDPNRIFTPAGFRRQFLGLGYYRDNTRANWTSHRRLLHRDGRRLARLVEEAYHQSGQAVVAVHDNHAPMAWARRIFRGEAGHPDSRKAWHRRGDNYRTFFYVSKERDYEALRGAGFSVILQDNRRVRDDGSAGVLFGKRGVRYFCLEVPRDRKGRAEHRRELNRMLDFTVRLLGKG